MIMNGVWNFRIDMKKFGFLLRDTGKMLVQCDTCLVGMVGDYFEHVISVIFKNRLLCCITRTHWTMLSDYGSGKLYLTRAWGFLKVFTSFSTFLTNVFKYFNEIQYEVTSLKQPYGHVYGKPDV